MILLLEDVCIDVVDLGEQVGFLVIVEVLPEFEDVGLFDVGEFF